MTKITWKPGTLLAPVPPALITSGTMEEPNIMTAAWTGIICSEPPMTYVSIRPQRYSHHLISSSREFVINLANLPLVEAADFCGVKSGKDVNKFREMHLTASPCSEVKAPQIEESPVSLECKVKEIRSHGSHDMFLAEIVAVNVDDKYIDEDGKLWLEKAGLIAYAHGHYFTLGRNLGKFGFSVNKKRLAHLERKKQSENDKALSKFSNKKGVWIENETAEEKDEKSFNFKHKKKYGNNRGFKKNKSLTHREEKFSNSTEKN